MRSSNTLRRIARLALCSSAGLAVSVVAGYGTTASAEPVFGGAMSAGTNQSDENRDEVLFGNGAERLMARFPGTNVRHDAGLSTAYGSPMTTGATPDEAAADFVADFGDAIGGNDGDGAELVPTLIAPSTDGRFTYFHYVQEIDGLPVDGSLARVVVRNADNLLPDAVVLATGRLAPRPAAALMAGNISPDDAVASAANLEGFDILDRWHEPTKIIWDDNGNANASHVAWKVQAEGYEGAHYEGYSFFVDANTGDVLEVRNEVHTIDVTGVVVGMGTPGVQPDTGANPPVQVGLPHLQVTVNGSNSAFSDAAGNFNVPFGGSGAVTLNADLNNGVWANINDQQTSELSRSIGATAGVPASFNLNPTPNQNNVAQVNAFRHTGLIHDLIRDRNNLVGLDIQLPVNTNINLNCNAFFSSINIDINFYVAGGGCENTAFSSVVAHEYGHFVVNRLGLSQGAFGEGFGDTCSMLLYDDPLIGDDFFGPGTTVRDPLVANVQFPCPQSGSHFCGQILGATWWRIRTQLGSTYGSATGLETARQLWADWMMVTGGGQGSNSAHPTTAIEVLTVDDNDGNLNNGTPNYVDLCTAFGQASIDCPEISIVEFQYPDGVPSSVLPGMASTVRFNVVGVGGSPIAGSGEAFASVNGGPYNSLSVVQGAANEYTATLPLVDCGDTLSFYFSSDTSGAITVSDPADAPSSAFSAPVATSINTIVDTDFNTDPGFTVTTTASAGQWQRGVPVDCNRGDPSSDFDGSGQCWLTENDAGDCNSDVDSGVTILTSPVIDATGDAIVSYARWFDNQQGGEPGADVFDVEISNGGAWVLVERVGPGGAETFGGWFQHEFLVSDFVTPNASVQVRFRAGDLGGGSIVEAAVDAFKVEQVECVNVPVDCPGDLTTTGGSNPGVPDGVTDLSDLLYFVNIWDTDLGNTPGSEADLTTTGGGAPGVPDGTVDLSDLLYYVNLWTTGLSECP